MPCSACDFSVLAYAGGFTLWHCRLTDPAGAPPPAGPAAAPGRPRPGDLVVASGPQGTTILAVGADGLRPLFGAPS